jgi:hypothetical protein
VEVVKVVALMPNTDGTVIGKLGDKALEGIVKRHGAIVHRSVTHHHHHHLFHPLRGR